MKLEKEQHIKILFKNGASVEGIVECWEPGNYKLKSLNDSSLLIIISPEEDIMIIKVILKEKEQSLPKQDFLDETIKEQANNNTQLTQITEDVIDNLSAQDLRTKKLVELKQAAAKIEREDIASKLRNHKIGEIKEVNYGYPSFLNPKEEK